MNWLAELKASVRSDKLLKSKPSLSSLEDWAPTRQPRHVIMGVGLATRECATAALPVDILGMLLPAQRLRKVCGAQSVTVLLADTHAMTNDVSADEVAAAVRRTEALLWGLKERMGFSHLHILRASQFHQTKAYLIAHDRAARALDGEHPYVIKQIADMLYFEQHWGSFLKVGWTLNDTNNLTRSKRDEARFDLLARTVLQGNAGFVYAEPGRTLCPKARRVPPYINPTPNERINLALPQNVSDALSRAQKVMEPKRFAQIEDYFARIVSAWSRQVAAPWGRNLCEQLQTIVEQVAIASNTFQDAANQSVPHAGAREVAHAR